MPDAGLFQGRTHAVFDAYGTLFDVNAAVRRHAAAVGPDADAVSDLWRTKQLEYTWVLALMGRHVPFWTLTERALDHTLARYPSVDPSLRGPLLEAYRDLDAYPEVAEILARLRARGLRTAILSNGDGAMLERAVSSAGLADRIDACLSVEAAGLYKTAPAAYRLVETQLGAVPDETVFFSSNRWDVAGAAAFGFATVWVNRTERPDEYPDLPPARVVGTLSELA